MTGDQLGKNQTAKHEWKANLSIKQVADAIGKSAHTIRRYVLDGTLPAHKVAGKYGQEYRIDEIPSDLYNTKNNRSRSIKTAPGKQQRDPNLAAELLHGIDAVYSERIIKLESANTVLAVKLGKAQAEIVRLKDKLKSKTGPGNTLNVALKIVD